MMEGGDILNKDEFFDGNDGRDQPLSPTPETADYLTEGAFAIEEMAAARKAGNGSIQQFRVGYRQGWVDALACAVVVQLPEQSRPAKTEGGGD